MSDVAKPETISRLKKRRFLLEMSEDEFRDVVVRPLFLRQGFADGRELCGPFEKGKDAVFVTVDLLGIEDAYVVQTKKGKMNLSRKVNENLVEAITQLKTAADTRVVFTRTKEKKLPAKVVLCASGEINESARQHVVDAVHDPRLVFLDSEDLIPQIDRLYPELWLGIDADIAPYFRKLKQAIESADETLAMAELLPRDSQIAVATDQGFVNLQLHRIGFKLQNQHGQVVKVPHFEQMPVTGLPSKRKSLFVIFGGAGSGKTTSLKRLAYLLATKGLKFESTKPTIPILLKATEILGNCGRALVELCDVECRRVSGLSKASFSADDLAGGRVLVLVDALDELSDDGGRMSVLSVIKDFHRKYPECKVVLTSRDTGAVNRFDLLKSFETYHISPIDYKQAEKIIRSLQKGRPLPAEKSQELVRRLEEVHGLELNPLLVTVFAATTEYSRQDIPANITELFKKFTEMMLGRWDASKGFKFLYQTPLKDFVLTKVAFEMHREKVTSVDLRRFDSIVRREFVARGLREADAELLRDEVLNRSGLFTISEGMIQFRHLMIQEFFAGRGIPSLEYLHTIVTDPWWNRAVVFYFGENSSNVLALRSTIEAIRNHPTGEKYTAALTLGLALQACYLVEVADKIEIYQWVVDNLSNAQGEFLSEGESAARFPMNRFLLYYLLGRDSVALSVLESRVPEILEKWKNSALTQAEKDVRTFWVICGLIECGAIADVERLVMRFKPDDARLLLGVHLGCYLTQEVRVCTREERGGAKRICDALGGRIEHLRAQLLDELKSELLEMRRGDIRTIDVQPRALGQSEDTSSTV